MNSFRMVSLVVNLVFLLSASNIFAQVPVAEKPAQVASPVYAVLSLVGDRFDIVSAVRQTGARIDRNYRTPLPIAIDAFDKAVIDAVGREIVKLDKRSEIAALNTRSPVLFEKHRELFFSSNSGYVMPNAIREAVAAQKATHLILVTKHKDEAVLKYRDGYDGVGRLEGLGFYLDTLGETSNIVPYVYIKLDLVEMASSRLLSTRLIRASIALTKRGALAYTTGEAWEVLTSAEKVRIIEEMLRDEIAKAMPYLIQGK